MTTRPGQDDHEAVDATEDPAVDPTDAGFPASPDLAEGNHDFTDGDPGDEAGDVD